MFDLNEPASPVTEFEPNGTCKEYRGLTKFEQCAKDFAAAAMKSLLERANAYDTLELCKAARDSVNLGIYAAEEFCRQMEEREK